MKTATIMGKDTYNHNIYHIHYKGYKGYIGYGVSLDGSTLHFFATDKHGKVTNRKELIQSTILDPDKALEDLGYRITTMSSATFNTKKIKVATIVGEDKYRKNYYHINEGGDTYYVGYAIDGSNKLFFYKVNHEGKKLNNGKSIWTVEGYLSPKEALESWGFEVISLQENKIVEPEEEKDWEESVRKKQNEIFKSMW